MSTKLFIDIETIPGDTPPDMETLNPNDYLVGTPPKYGGDKERQEAWIKEQEHKKVTKYNEDYLAQEIKQKDLHAKQALNSMQGKIVCVSYACGDAPVTTIEAKDEVVIIESLFGALDGLKMSRFQEFTFIGHNVWFDLQYLHHKSLYYNSNLKTVLPKYRDYERWVDTNIEWNMGQRNKYTKLSDICQFLGIKQLDQIDGSQVWDAYKSGRIDQIIEHCESDVRAVRELYKRLR